MNQQGVTFLEIVVVIAILMITSALVAPNIQDWRQKRALEADFQAILAKIDYLKARARTLNGTGLLVCNGQGDTGSVLTYQITTNPQAITNSVVSGGIVEDPVAQNASFNLLSGKTKLVSSLCNAGARGVFIATGQTGIEGSGGQVDIKIGLQSSSTKVTDFRILVNQSTGFVQKFKGSISNGTWTEIE